MATVNIILQLILSLSILVVLHEAGHFAPAKFFKTRVEKFYLFFNPWFSLFKKKIGETEYGVGWLPLGGYVKISGMIDESMDKEQMKQPAKPWEFRSKPAWQRLIIMLGGVIVNFILGFLIWGMVLFVWGKNYLPNDSATYGIAVDSSAMELGMQDGDLVIKVGDKLVDRVDDGIVIREVVFNDAREIIVSRNGGARTIQVPDAYVRRFASQEFRNKDFFAARAPFVISKVKKGGPAYNAGLEVGDKIIGVDGKPTPFFIDFKRAIVQHKDELVNIGVERDGKVITYPVAISEQGTIGVANERMSYFFDLATESYSVGEALSGGVTEGLSFLGNQITAFGKMFSGEIKVTESLGGFGTISGLFSKTWNWQVFWLATAILSLILGFMNLLPIPALDGGHVMFLIYEVITGRKPSDKFMEIATIVGFIIILGLVILANGLDILRAS